jgi:YebC/PmpR family DNA-binding regulatory protein
VVPGRDLIVSGHSKWATIKHRKGAQDKARGKLFARLIRQVEVAAREGGGDLEANATLRTMYQKARDASVPTDTIDRAVKRGTGELEGVRYEAVTYEGYAPNGVAVLVECLTDNRNRAGAAVRNVFARNGGSIAEPGAVAWQFERKGVVLLPRRPAGGSEVTEDDLMAAALDAGAEDIRDQGDAWEVTSAPSDLPRVRDALEQAGIAFDSADLIMQPTAVVPLEDEAEARRVLRVVDALEDVDDVQAVHANFDVPDAVLQAVEA